jgi:hypothetical protein
MSKQIVPFYPFNRIHNQHPPQYVLYMGVYFMRKNQGIFFNPFQQVDNVRRSIGNSE